MALIPHRDTPGRRPRGLAVLLAGLLALLLVLPSCDNPACVFGGSCNGSTSGGAALGTNPAAFPPDHAWILTGAPTVTQFFPSGTTINTATPIVVVFSESMAAQTLVTSVALFSTAGFGAPVPTLPVGLVGDGRVMVVVPAVPLDPGGDYELRWTDQSVITDITGTTLTQQPDRVIGSFTVAATDPVVPRVLTTWPPDGASNQSATGEIVVFFDRPMVQGSVTSQSFAVTVDSVTPTPNPPAQPVLLIGPTAFPTTDTRVWRYRKVDGAGNAVSLGAGGAVHLELSPGSDPILAQAGGVLPNTELDFDVASFSAPISAEIVSLPTDAIGIENLDGDLTSPLDIALTLDGALNSDRIGIFLFGQALDGSQTITLFRETTVGAIGYDPMTMVATLTEAQLDIASSTSPVTARFDDGEFAIALRTERNGQFSPVRLVDVDLEVQGPQNALLDTTRPTFTAFGTSGNDSSTFVSDLRHLAVVGRASEELRSVEVTAGGSNNGAFPPVVGSSSGGLFVAAPVLLDVVDPATQPVMFSMEIYDRALNSTASTINADFMQRGAVGPGSALPGFGSIDIDVFDARTLSPVSGAVIYVHNDNAGAVTFISTGTTTATGFLNLTAGANLSIVTVEAPGYDVVSYHGVPVSSISLPLQRSNVSPGRVLGTVSSTNQQFSQYDLFVADSRQFDLDEPVLSAGCSASAAILGWDCAYGPADLRLGAPRVISSFAVLPPIDTFNFNAKSFLRGYSFELPFSPPSAGSTSTVDFDVNPLLDDPSVPLEQQVLAGPQANLSIVGLTGVDPADLDGEPRAVIEARVRGMHGSALAGAGAALDPVGTRATQWTVSTAIPGVVDPTSGKYAGDELGELVDDGVIDPDLFLRVEVRDNAGNVVGRRPRFPNPGVPGSLVPLDVADITAPAPGGNTLGDGFNLTFNDRIATGGGGQPGLYRATIVDQAGKVWRLYRSAGGGGSRRISVPDLPFAGGVGLADGPLACWVEAWAWTGFDETEFLFSDIEREYDRFSAGAPITLSKP